MPPKKDMVGGVVRRKKIVISDNEFAALGKVGNIPLIGGQKDALQKILNIYDGLFAAAAAAPEVRCILKRVEHLQHLSKELQDFFAAPPQGEEKAPEDKALKSRLKSHPNWKIACDLDVARFRYFNAYLGEIAEDYMLSRPIDKDGRTPDDSLDYLLAELLVFYDEVAKDRKKVRAKGIGRLPFILAALRLMPYCPVYKQNNGAIAQRIKRVKALHPNKKFSKKR